MIIVHLLDIVLHIDNSYKLWYKVVVKILFLTNGEDIISLLVKVIALLLG